MNSPFTYNQIIYLLSQHPMNPRVLFEEEPSPVHPSLVINLCERPDGEVEAIFYPGFFHIPAEEQNKFLKMALEHLDELYLLSYTDSARNLMRMAQNLLQMEHAMGSNVHHDGSRLYQGEIDNRLPSRFRDFWWILKTGLRVGGFLLLLYAALVLVFSL